MRGSRPLYDVGMTMMHGNIAIYRPTHKGRLVKIAEIKPGVSPQISFNCWVNQPPKIDPDTALLIKMMEQHDNAPS